MVLIAIVENLNELGDGNLPLLAGCNITGVITKGEKEDDDDDKVRTLKNLSLLLLFNKGAT